VAGAPLHPTEVVVHLDRLTHNLRLLQDLAGEAEVWPVLKANAYGHGAVLIARHLVGLGCRTLCVANGAEAVELVEAGVRARFVLLSVGLPEASECIVEHGFEPVVCTPEVAEALSCAAARAGRTVAAHVKVDTGMGRAGIRPDEVAPFLERCRRLPGLRVQGLMSHFPRADEPDKGYSRAQVAVFRAVRAATRGSEIAAYHLANTAGLLDLPEGRFDAVRPGIGLYGLAPSATIQNPRVRDLRPVLEWRTRITFLKEVPAGAGLSYGHTFRTAQPSLIATLPVGYADGLPRQLSNTLPVLVHGTRCPEVGRITMDQCLVDVSALRGRVALGDEAVLIGRQGAEEVRAEELAARLDTIAYEVVTAISRRVPRAAVGGDSGARDASWVAVDHSRSTGRANG
jgi:alanine racemase